jgi:hypothetical protein
VGAIDPTRRALAAVLLAGLLLSGCGGEEEKPAARPVSSYLRPPPSGFRYVTVRNDSTRRFEARLRKEFGADDVVVRNVCKGKRFMAGLVLLRSRRPRSASFVAERSDPGSTGPEPITIAGRSAHHVRSLSGPETVDHVTVIDTFGRMVLVVQAKSLPIARRVAAPLVR